VSGRVQRASLQRIAQGDRITIDIIGIEHVSSIDD